jgi:2,3-bisphosphoglycerate-independent phosphoglycerate mutase
MPTLQEKYGIRGAIISAVDLIKGIGACLDMKVINVPGATGFYDTNYEGKAEYAIRALEKFDLILIHVEAPDEAGHEGDFEKKIKAIEDLDRRLLGKLLDGLSEESTIAVLPDHPTPVSVRTHTNDPVPFTICSPRTKPDGVRCFDEISARKGGFGLLEGTSFMKRFIKSNS